MGRVGLDVGAQGEVDVEGLADAVVEHAEPVAAGLFEFNGAEQVAGLDDDLEGVGEIVGELADFQGKVLRNLRGAVCAVMFAWVQSYSAQIPSWWVAISDCLSVSQAARN